MTEPRYLTDSTARRFEATVERALDDRVVLDATLFYPEGGGQPADRGTLAADGDRWRVVDVQKQDTVYHELEPVGDAPPVPAAGSTVTGEVDWERRSAHMRYHTAQHLLSALLLEEFGAETVGNQLTAEYARLDAAYDRFTEADLARIEARLNALVAEARPVEWYTMDREEAEATLDPERTRIDLLPSSITDLRIVEIGAPTRAPDAADEGAAAGEDGAGRDADAADGDGTNATPFDRTACAGTHVANTSEIGTVRVTGRTTQGSDAERLRFVLE